MISRIQWHFFAVPTDLGVLENDVNTNLFHADSTNGEGAFELLVINQASHPLAFLF